MGRLKDKVAVITGAGMGMGRTEALLFAEEGAKVIATDILEREGQQTTDMVTKHGGQVEFIKLDVSKENEWQNVIEQVSKNYGKIDILVNNAGILLSKTLDETTADEWDKIFATNSKGVFYGCKYVLPAMQKAGGGSIINISSIYGIIGAPSAAAYEASKGSVRELTKAAAVDYAKYNIRVNSVHPGLIDTPMTQDIIKNPKRMKSVLCTTLFERPGTAMEVAYPVLMLASDESSYMTGCEIVVDGGYTAC